MWRSFDIPLPDGRRLHVRERGSGPLDCLLIHGFGEGGYVWDEFAGSLPGACRALIVDLCGHGESSWNAGGVYGAERHVADVASIVDACCCHAVVLVGHSLGGHIALRVAAEGACDPAGLVVVDFGPELNPAAKAAIRAALAENARTYASKRDYAAWLEQSRPLASPATVRRLANGALRAKAGGGFELKVDPRLAGSIGDAEDDGALWSMLETITCPTLVVRGAGSALLPRRVAERMTQTLRRATFQSVRGAGHAVMTDNPAGFASAVRPFLSEIAEARCPSPPVSSM